MKTMTYLTRNHVSDICHHYLATGSNFNECGIFFHLFGHWWKICDNWRSWLHIQKVYIHSYLALVDFGALRNHIFTNIDDFLTLTPPGANFWMNLVYFLPIWLLVTRWRQFQILVAIAKALYPFILHFGGFCGIEWPYLKQYWRFINFDTSWGKCFMNLGHFFTYLTTGDKLVTIGYLGCMSKMFISINTSLWWILWHRGNLFWQILTIS